jgi:hypothetical protein
VSTKIGAEHSERTGLASKRTDLAGRRHLILMSARRHPERAVEPDDLTVEHAVVDDMGNQ